MKIDRHNYEEFFLLYIDNELSVDQKKQVEAFLSANPEFEEDFVMLQQARLVADDSIVFDGKESLMKDASEVNMSNYEEWLLLYVDNELTTEQKLLVEKFAAANPHVKEEWDLFLKTKLEPQEIIFADKSSLYRKEEKVRVIHMSWWRIAAAAILILAAGFGTWSVITNSGEKPGNTATIDNTTPAKTNQQEQKRDEGKEGTQPAIRAMEEENKNLAVRQDQKEKDKQKQKDVVVPKQEVVENNPIAKIDEQPVINKQKENAVASNSIQSNNTTAGNPNTTASVSIETSKPVSHQQIINNPGVTNKGDETPDYTKANMLTSFDETASNDENKRLRGFFRRAARFIERTTKVNPANDDNKVLIGAMAVSLK
jgi:hypothetical protein